MEISYQITDGVAKLYPKCTAHNWYFCGTPPLTTGCKECWEVYWLCQHMLTPNDKKAESLDALEECLHHAAELDAKGQWDFKPNMQIESIEEDAI